MLIGFALFGTVYVLPQYLGQVQRYNAEQIGNVLAWTGLPQLLLIPLVPLLMKRFDVRYIGALGIGLFAASSFMNITLSPDIAGDQLLIPNIVRAIGQALMLTPISAITTAGIGPGEAGAASGLSNMLRNLGGAVGTATLATILTKREQFHSNIIGQSVTLYRDEVRQRITDLTNYFISHGVADPAAAKHQAIVAIGNTVKRQALIMGFSDTFAVIGVILAIAAVALLFARKAKPGAAGGGALTRAAHLGRRSHRLGRSCPSPTCFAGIDRPCHRSSTGKARGSSRHSPCDIRPPGRWSAPRPRGDG